MTTAERIVNCLASAWAAERDSGRIVGLGIVAGHGEDAVLTYIDATAVRAYKVPSDLTGLLAALGAARTVEAALSDVDFSGRAVIAVADSTDAGAGDADAFARTIGSRMASLLNEPDSEPAMVERLRRLEAVDALVPAFHRVLDLRDIFDGVSRVTASALPHDAMVLGLFNDDCSEVSIYASTSECRPQGAARGAARADSARRRVHRRRLVPVVRSGAVLVE